MPVTTSLAEVLPDFVQGPRPGAAAPDARETGAAESARPPARGERAGAEARAESRQEARSARDQEQVLKAAVESGRPPPRGSLVDIRA